LLVALILTEYYKTGLFLLLVMALSSLVRFLTKSSVKKAIETPKKAPDETKVSDTPAEKTVPPAKSPKSEFQQRLEAAQKRQREELQKNLKDRQESRRKASEQADEE